MRASRHPIIKDAKIAFLKFWIEFEEIHDDLTPAELLSILAEQQQSLINSILRTEWEEAKA